MLFVEDVGQNVLQFPAVSDLKQKRVGQDDAKTLEKLKKNLSVACSNGIVVAKISILELIRSEVNETACCYSNTDGTHLRFQVAVKVFVSCKNVVL